MAIFDILILAAGESRRMTGIKQLLQVGNSTFLELTIRKSMTLEPRKIVVVLGAHAETITPVVQHYPVAIVQNPNWKEGMGGSIAAGVRFIEEQNSPAAGLLILLCDQPNIIQDHSFLNDLIAQWAHNPQQAVATRYESRFGVPALFPPKFMTHLNNLKGDKGARELLNSGLYPIKSIDSRGIGIDIDTDEAYERFLKA